MKILARQEFGLTLLKPLRAGQRLALGTLPVSAGIICIPFVGALVTSFHMTAECRGATQFDGAQHPPLPLGQRSSMRLTEFIAVGTHNIGDFQGGPHGEAA
jgi:hypothetical protein